ncbi:MAG: LacI family DNA-binding transcriptional regulator, partial [Shimia sp.]
RVPGSEPTMPPPRIRTMEEFAARSGLSRPTVSKYFQDPTSVRASTRAKIEAALAEVDYRPNVYAMNQNRRLTRNVGVVVPLLADPFFSEIARTIERHCVEAGFRPILLSSNGEAEQEEENLQTLLGLKPAGMLIAPLGHASDAEAIERFATEVPTVLFDSNVGGLGAGFVGLDVRQSIAMQVDYLCESGSAPCFFEMATPPNPNAARRRAAYVAAMERRAETPRIVSVPGTGWDFEETGLREGGALIARGGLPSDTVLCSNDRLAIGLLAAAYQTGTHVGREGALRVAGHDDHPFARYTAPPLTTVAQDYDRIAGRSLDMLMGIVEAGRPPQARTEALLDGRLVVRGSA